MFLPEGMFGMLPPIPWSDIQPVLPNPSLPFDKRWFQAESLPTPQKVEFVRRELFPVSSGLPRRHIELAPADILEKSLLNPSLKHYLLASLNPRFYQERWGRDPRIEVSVGNNTPPYHVDLFIGTGGPTGYGFGIAIEAGTSRGAYIPAWILPRILPFWEFEGERADSANPAVKLIYDELKRHIAEVTKPYPDSLGSLTLVRELVSFVREISGEENHGAS